MSSKNKQIDVDSIYDEVTSSGEEETEKIASSTEGLVEQLRKTASEMTETSVDNEESRKTESEPEGEGIGEEKQIRSSSPTKQRLKEIALLGQGLHGSAEAEAAYAKLLQEYEEEEVKEAQVVDELSDKVVEELLKG